MRPIYFLLYIIHSYVLRVVFTRVAKRNAPKKRRNISIIVSNHPSAFMDPLVIAGFQKPIVFFMTRSDVFKPVLKPIFAAANMLPIYRQMDGPGAVKKNQVVFEECYELLTTKRSPLLFGEGLTDDVFERRLKPIRKGAARIAFGAMEFHNWKLDLKVHCIGLNYEDPTKLRSGLVISNAPFIEVKAYKELYLSNATAAINKLTNDIELAIRNEITHIENSSDFELHEHIMRLTKKGMHVIDSDKNIRILDRQVYSKKLANQINEYSKNDSEKCGDLKHNLKHYFDKLSQKKIENSFIDEIARNQKLSNFGNIIYLVFMLPLALLGIILMWIPYLITNRFIESTFKRKVFWLSTKMAVGMLIGGFYNILMAVLFYHFVYPNYLVAILFYFTIPVTSFLVAYEYRKRYKKFVSKNRAMKLDLTESVAEREELLKQIKSMFPEL